MENIQNGCYSASLYHHGIKGQRWGIRRFQNEDGSLTSAGKERYEYKTVGELKEEHRNNIEKIKSQNLSRQDKTKAILKENSDYKKKLNVTNTIEQKKDQHSVALKDIDKMLAPKKYKNFLKKIENKNYEEFMNDPELAIKKEQAKKIALGVGAVAAVSLAAYGIYKYNSSMDSYYLKNINNYCLDTDKVSNMFGRTTDAKYFTSSAAADAYNKINNFNKDWHTGLNEKEKNGVYKYTSNFYHDMNEVLRFGKSNPDAKYNDKIKSYIEGCTDALEKTSIKEDTITHRGIGDALGKMLNISPEDLLKSDVQNSLVGMTFLDKGFGSSGGSTIDAWGGTKMHIFIPKGSKAMYVDPISAFPGEHEILIQRNTMYAIKSFSTNAEGKITDLFVEIIKQTL